MWSLVANFPNGARDILCVHLNVRVLLVVFNPEAVFESGVCLQDANPLASKFLFKARLNVQRHMVGSLVGSAAKFTAEDLSGELFVRLGL